MPPVSLELLRLPVPLVHSHILSFASVTRDDEPQPADVTPGSEHPREVVDMTFLAVVALLLTVATLAVPGGVLFTPFLFGLFLLALVGVLGRLEDRTVRQHDPALDPRRWRNGS
jgi:hypothetical protein